ncbi:UGA2 [Candida oxycetoniae]|uniref:succinate-semialdehyde dehydrogenase [NAD(P)(+)] n=1 Tax=Candida oxycetoniae TaxID=497107 RepID=A0AAI9SZM4_9ASCO|nr:UGA2 [Candida oxycetoniae]KAI3406126.2 UGA2 [Candida oxycetoniae]
MSNTSSKQVIADYLILSLPQSAHAREWLEQSLNNGKQPLFNLNVPDFQSGTLDSLVQESEELSKIDQQLGSSVSKVVEILNTVSESKIVSSRTIQSRSIFDYVQNFHWNTSKYRLDRPISQLVKIISSEAITLDNDVRSSYQNYQTAKSNFVAADRKRNGDLSIKSLHEIVKPEQFVLDSENLVTILIAVPNNLVSDFKSHYETLTQFVIPRSTELIAKDSEFSLFTVTLFKKFQQEFINNARERKWHPRTDFVYSEETLNNLRKEFDITKATELKSKSELIRLSKTAYSDIVACWFHIKVIRVYVEAVLRYGLPPQFDNYLIKFEGNNLKNVGKAKKELIEKFGYLGGDGYSSNNSNLHEYASLVDSDYEPFVFVTSYLKNPNLFQTKPFVNNEFIDSKSTKTFKVVNPATEEVIAELPEQTPEEIEEAIKLTHEAFQSFRKSDPYVRAKMLRKLYDLMMENLDDLATIITLENGKCLTDAKGEIKYGASYFEWFSEEAKRVYGNTIQPSNRNNKIITYKQPVGPVGLLCPFNFPSAMGTRKAAPAWAVGCTCILKPDGQTPLSSLALAYLAREAGFPPGVFNVVLASVESTPMVGQKICESPLIKKVSFTGSTAVGKLLVKQSSQTLKKLSMELGGNAPVVVFDDADLELAIEQAVASKFRSLGQTCVCANRLYVQNGIYKEFCEKFSEKVRQFKIDNGLVEGVTHGCLINTKSIDKVESHAADAIKRGAKVLVKGGRLPDLGKNFYAPTVLCDVPQDSKVFHEETFGPLAAITSFSTRDEVLKLCNDTPFGLASYIFSQDINTIWYMSEFLETGMVSVNTGIFTDAALPFGGIKESGFGREGSLYGMDDYTVIKSINLGNVYK